MWWKWIRSLNIYPQQPGGCRWLFASSRSLNTERSGWSQHHPRFFVIVLCFVSPARLAEGQEESLHFGQSEIWRGIWSDPPWRHHCCCGRKRKQTAKRGLKFNVMFSVLHSFIYLFFKFDFRMVWFIYIPSTATPWRTRVEPSTPSHRSQGWLILMMGLTWLSSTTRNLLSFIR